MLDNHLAIGTGSGGVTKENNCCCSCQLDLASFSVLQESDIKSLWTIFEDKKCLHFWVEESIKICEQSLLFFVMSMFLLYILVAIWIYFIFDSLLLFKMSTNLACMTLTIRIIKALKVSDGLLFLSLIKTYCWGYNLYIFSLNFNLS